MLIKILLLHVLFLTFKRLYQGNLNDKYFFPERHLHVSLNWWKACNFPTFNDCKWYYDTFNN